DADDVVDVFTDDWDSRMTRAHAQRGCLPGCFSRFNPDHFRTRHHHLANRRGCQVEHRLDHAALFNFHDAMFLGDIDHLTQFHFSGVRAIAETWAGRDDVADPDEATGNGAKDFS